VTETEVIPRIPWRLTPSRSVGDKVWLYEGHPSRLVEAVVELVWYRDDHMHPYYICRISDPEFIHYVVRDDYTTTSNPKHLPRFVETKYVPAGAFSFAMGRRVS
jgi:hypothetical protein